MRKSFVNNPSPMLIGVVREKTAKEAMAAIKNCQYDGADGIDLHLSCLNAEEKNEKTIREIVDFCERPILALNYNQAYDWSEINDSEEERVELLLAAVKAGVAAVDIQGYTYDAYSKHNFRNELAKDGYSFAEGNPKEIVVDPIIIEKQTKLIEEIHSMGAEVLLSTHPSKSMTGEQLVDLALFLEKRKPDIIKIVTTCETSEELIESFRAMTLLKKEVKTKIHYHCSGRMGTLSRIVNPMLGAHLIFCSDGYTLSSNPDQTDLKTTHAVIENLKRII